MKSKLCSLTCIAALVIVLLAPVSAADSKSPNRMLKQQERYTLSLELEFSKKEQNPLEQAISVLFDVGPNGYATGFLVGNGIVMTAYHVISGNLSANETAAAMIASGQLRIVNNSENRGFGAANNQAFTLTESPFVFLLNLDTEVPPGTIDTLIEKLKADPKIGACGPRLLNPDGSVQVSVFFNPPRV